MGTAYMRWLTLQEIHESFMCHYKLTMERIHERSCAARFITGKKTFQPDMRGQRFPEDTAYHQIHCTYYHCVVKTIIIHSIS